MKKTGMIVILITFLTTGCSRTQTGAMFVQPSDVPQTTDESSTPENSASPSPDASTKITPKPTPTIPPVTVTSSLSINQLPSTWKSDESRDVQKVDTIIVHSLYNPNVKNGITIEDAKAVLDQSEVSAHYVIARDGKIYQLVSENYQAWHAGDSQMPKPDGRKKINEFSIGIELIGTEKTGFTTAQYTSLTNLAADISSRLPIVHILGHSDIAPGRKTDPWEFNWRSWQAELTLKTKKTYTFYH